MSSHPRRWSPGSRLTGWIRRRCERRHRSASGRLYAGHRGDRAAVYVVTRTGLAALPPVGSRALSYDWGTNNPEALALAGALLADVTGERVPAGVAASFAAGPVAALPRDGFVLDAHDLARWLARARAAAPSGWPPLWPGCPPLWPATETPTRPHRSER